MARVPGPNNVISTIQQLGQNLEEITRKTLYSAVIGRGGIIIDGTGGIQVTNGVAGLGQFYIGGGSTANPHADGSPQIVTIVGDEAGRDRFALYDENSPASQTNQRIHEWDQFGTLVRSQDTNGGWATPWFNVPMYPRFTANGAPAAYSSNSYYYASGYAQFQTTGNGISSGNDFWEGRIPFVTHPRINVTGVWGNISGTAPTYTLQLNGTTVGTFAQTALYTGQWTTGPFNIASYVGQTDVKVQIFVSWTGSGVVACDCLGVYLRQT